MSQQIKTITSEALEAAYRALTPSQDGFTEDLMASNTIIPVLDLTASAEGTTTPQYLQTAIAFGSQTVFRVENTTTTIINTPGFYRIFCIVSAYSGSALYFNLTDGLSTKRILEFANIASDVERDQLDFIVFLAAGESMNIQSSAPSSIAAGSTRQVADVNGNLVYPSGFTPQ